jgi:hypothetical protein
VCACTRSTSQSADAELSVTLQDYRFALLTRTPRSKI